MNKQTILVTGGAGFIGSHLVDALLDLGHHVRVFDNLEPQVHGPLREQERWPGYCNPEAETILGDVRDGEALRKAMLDVDVIFHEAAMVGVGQSMYQVERYVDVNSRGTAVMLDVLANEASLRERLRKLVVASSMSIYGEGCYECPQHGIVYPKLRPDEQLAAQAWEPRCPVSQSPIANLHRAALCGLPLQPVPTAEDKPLQPTSIYAIGKKDQEEMCLAIGQAYHVPTVALRYFNTYGPRQSLSNPYTGVAAIFSGRLLNRKPPVIYEDGNQSRDFVHVSDIVQANVLAMENSAADYGVFNVGSGQPITITGIAQALIERMDSVVQPQIVRKYRSGDIRHCFAAIDSLAKLGYKPAVSLEDGLAELVEWVRRQTAVDHFDRVRQELSSRGLAI